MEGLETGFSVPIRAPELIVKIMNVAMAIICCLLVAAASVTLLSICVYLGLLLDQVKHPTGANLAAAMSLTWIIFLYALIVIGCLSCITLTILALIQSALSARTWNLFVADNTPRPPKKPKPEKTIKQPPTSIDTLLRNKEVP